MNQKSWADKLERLEQRHDLRLEALGEQIQTKVLIPFCRKYGFEFVSGNGSFCFFKGGNNYGCGYNSDEFNNSIAGRAMAPILELLQSECHGGRHQIGMFIQCVFESDLTE